MIQTKLRHSLSLCITLLLAATARGQDAAPPAPPAEAPAAEVKVQPSSGEQAALDAAKGKIPGFIIFESNRDGAWHLYRMNSDGTDVRKLTNVKRANTGEPTYAAISPDGKTIAWEHRYTTQDGEIWLMDSDGGNQRPLYSPAENPKTRGNRPSWLPDGRLKFSRSGSMRKQTVWVYDFKKPDPAPLNLVEKITGKDEPDLPKNHQSWQEELLVDFREVKPKFQTKRILLHETTPDLKNFVAWCKYPGRGVWWMSFDGAKQEKIHGGCSPRVLPDGKNFIWVLNAGKFGIGSLTTPMQTQLLFGGPYPEVFDHGYFPYLTPDYQWLVFSACPFNEHDQETSNYQIFIVKMGPDLKPVGMPTRLTFNKSTERYPVMWYEGMTSPATPPTITGNAHELYGGPDEPMAGEDEEASEDAAKDDKQE